MQVAMFKTDSLSNVDELSSNVWAMSKSKIAT